MAAAFCDAVSVDAASIRCRRGMTMGTMAERAGLATICENAVSAMPAYTMAGASRPLASSTPRVSMAVKVTPLASAMSFLRSRRSARVPPHSRAGICTTSCTTPMNPTSTAEPVSSSSHWAVARMRIQTTMVAVIRAAHSTR